MKRLLAILLCTIVLVCAMPIAVFAEDDVSVETSETPKQDITESEAWKEAELTTEKIVGYIQAHLEEISVIATLILTLFYQIRKHASLNKSIGILNNNAVGVAESSAATIGEALKNMTDISAIVTGYKEEMANMLTEVRANEEEKHKLATTLATVNKYLETAKAANLELSNEVAELLVLANIPNSKKEELYSRHRTAVDAIAATEKTEVNADDEQKA